MSGECPFTGRGCDGGETYQDVTVGCGFMESPDAECAWMADVPDGTSPRDFYNAKMMEAIRS